MKSYLYKSNMQNKPHNTFKNYLDHLQMKMILKSFNYFYLLIFIDFKLKFSNLFKNNQYAQTFTKNYNKKGKLLKK